MGLPPCNKTVLVVDHGPHASKLSNYQVTVEGVGGKGVEKTQLKMWSWNVQAMLEYCRVIWDIYPMQQYIMGVASDVKAHLLNSWESNKQNMLQLTDSLTELGPPGKAQEGNIFHGLAGAVDALAKPSPAQQRLATADSRNGGRLLCLTHINTESQLQTIVTSLAAVIAAKNKDAASHNSDAMALEVVELEIINVFPYAGRSNIQPREPAQHDSVLTWRVRTVESGQAVARLLGCVLVQQHYNLASTTVIGIPMKEEQNAASSANYDVELLHPATLHDEIKAIGSYDAAAVANKDGLPFHTVTLKWYSPKTNPGEMLECPAAGRVTPVEVASRPSACLVGFLLQGRTVNLELPRRGGGRVVSHVLCCHGGALFIHALVLTKTLLDDPPSLSEGPGGRLTDYRVTEFAEVTKDFRLAPGSQLVAQFKKLPIDRAQDHIERLTRHLPVVKSETVIFNMASHLDPLPSLIVKERMDEEDVTSCRSAILHLVGMESRNEALTVPSASFRGKASKRDEQYRQMWAELEMFVRHHGDTSPAHQAVLECLLSCKPSGPAPSSQPGNGAATPKTDSTVPSIRSPSPEIVTVKKFKFESSLSAVGGSSVLEMWSGQVKATTSQSREFAGRQVSAGGGPAPLYVKSEAEESGGRNTPQPKSSILRRPKT